MGGRSRFSGHQSLQADLSTKAYLQTFDLVSRMLTFGPTKNPLPGNDSGFSQKRKERSGQNQPAPLCPRIFTVRFN
jgi:hypothetical protein